MSLKRETSQCGSDLFSNCGSENSPSADIKQGIFHDETASNMNSMDNSEITNPVILEASNPPFIMQYGNASKTKTTELCDQSDAMSDFLFSLVKMERILEKKQKAVAVLKGMNETVESQVSTESSPVTPEFQHKYATLILHLDELNQELKYHIGIVLHHITETPPPINADGYVPHYQGHEFHVSMPTQQCSVLPIYESQEMVIDTLPMSGGSCDVVYSETKFVGHLSFTQFHSCLFF